MSHFVLAARLCDARLFRDPTYFREWIHGSLYMFLLLEFWRSVYSNGLAASSIYSLNFFWRRCWGRHGGTISLWSAAEYFVVISCCVFAVAKLEMKVTLGHFNRKTWTFIFPCFVIAAWTWMMNPSKIQRSLRLRGHKRAQQIPLAHPEFASIDCHTWVPLHNFQLLSFRHAKTL